uniref:Vacuolar protein sorting-associated protein 54 C-terminal domain-containing protein n=1 Tax=Spumella elongata TaxID=89044 RepID=A0A7S3M365_9STRA
MAIQWEDPQSQKIGTIGNTPSSNTSGDILYEELDGLADFTHASLSVPITTANATANANAPDSTTTQKLTMEGSLKQLLQSLILTERTQSALNMYKHRLLDAIKLIVRTCVMEYLTHFDPSVAYDDNSFDTSMGGSGGDSAYGSAETPFAQKVREMKADNFLSCLSMCFEHVMVSVQKANLFHQFIETHLNANIGTFEASIAESAEVNNKTDHSAEANTPSTVSPEARIHTEEYKQVQLNMISMSKTCLTAACDLAQRSISQLINLRKDANAKLNPEKMKFMWEISLDFVLSLEAVSGTTAYIIRQCLQAQTKSFLDYLHETCKGKLVVTLDNERWVQCDVSAERQVQIDRLSSGKAFLPQALHAQGASVTKSTSNASMSTNPAASAGATEVKKLAKDKESRPVTVDHVPFKVVWSVMLLVEVIQTYLDVALHFAPVTTDVINKSVEMLRLFDHRSRQLVLGAQAIQSAARLKSISVKHLALTGQSLSLLLALLPHIRAALLAQLPAKHQLLLTELDRVSHDLLEHHNQIVAKFVAIISDHVDNLAVSTLKMLDWDHFQGLRCEYFEEVQKAVINIHRVLQTTLPQSQVQDVFSRIFALLNRKIPAHFEEINPNTQTGRQRILDEITHLVTAFSRIKQIDASALTDSLEETFRKRYMRDR